MQKQDDPSKRNQGSLGPGTTMASSVGASSPPLKPVAEPSSKAAQREASWWNSSTNDDGPASMMSSATGRGPRQSATAKLKQFKPLPVLGLWPIRRQTTLALVGAALFGLATMGNLWLGYSDVSVLKSQADAVHDLSMLFQETSKTAQRALVGDEDAFATLRAALPLMAQDMQAVNAQTMPEASEARVAVGKNWNDAQVYLSAIVRQEDSLRRIALEAKDINAQNTQLIARAEPVMSALMQANAPQTQLVYFGQTLTVMERLGKNATAMLVQDDRLNASASAQMSHDAQDLNQLLQAFVVGAQNMPAIADPTLHAQVQNLAALFAAMQPKITDLTAQTTAMANIKAVGRPLLNASDQAVRNLGTIEAAYDSVAAGRSEHKGISLSLALATLACLALFAAMVSKFNTFQRLRAEADNEQIDAAIGQMILDLDAIARGDLTRRATVVEVNVGTLATSLNNTVGELADLVRRVKKTAMNTESASKSAMEATSILIETSRRQSQGVLDGGQEILKLTSSVDDVSTKAEESAHVASASLEASRRGTEAIESSQKSMLTIRERVEEAENRVKRLTESSKEIGGIVTVMTDLAEQTAVLAVNAAVQAAKAGDAGKGFKVVAEGVRELAEKSGEFSRRVGALVETALADIEGTLLTVQRATQETDEGARLTDITNDALMTIGEVSARLAELISEISQQTSEQARTAAFLSENTQASLSVAEEAKQQTQNASEAIARVADVTRELGQSIKGFKV